MKKKKHLKIILRTQQNVIDIYFQFILFFFIDFFCYQYFRECYGSSITFFFCLCRGIRYTNCIYIDNLDT